MRLLLTRSKNISLTIKITHLTLSLLCRLLSVRLGDSIVNLSEFYSYRLIGKLTTFLQFQEFSQCNQIWELSSTFTTRLSDEVSLRFSWKPSSTLGIGKEKITVKNFSRRDCYTIVLGNLVIIRFSVHFNDQVMPVEIPK